MVARMSSGSRANAASSSRIRAASAPVANPSSLNLLRPAAKGPGSSLFLSGSNNPLFRLSSVVVCAASSKSLGDKVEPTFRVSGELLSSAPPALVWEVLTDYDGAASIFGNVSESRVLGPLSEHRKGDGGEVASPSPAASSSSSSSSSPFLSAPFSPSAIEQHCSWKFLLFGGSFRMMLGVEEGPSSLSSSVSSSSSFASSSSDSDSSAAAEERSLVFSLLEPGFVRAFEGVWSVAVVEEEEDDDGGGWSSSSNSSGRRRRSRTVVKHSLGVTPSVPPPLPVRPVVRKLFQKQVAGLLDDLERELERRMKLV